MTGNVQIVETAILPEDLSASSAGRQKVARGAEVVARVGVERHQRGAKEKAVKVAPEGASLMKTQAAIGIVKLVGHETLLAGTSASNVVHHNHIVAAEAEVEAAMLLWDEARVARVLVEARVIPVEAAVHFLQAPESGREVVRQEATHQARLRSHSQGGFEQGLAQAGLTRCKRLRISSLVHSLRRSHRAWW